MHMRCSVQWSMTCVVHCVVQASEVWLVSCTCVVQASEVWLVSCTCVVQASEVWLVSCTALFRPVKSDLCRALRCSCQWSLTWESRFGCCARHKVEQFHLPSHELDRDKLDPISLIHIVTGIATNPWLSGNMLLNIKTCQYWWSLRKFENHGIEIARGTSILITKSINLQFYFNFERRWGPLWSTAIFRA